ncbi:MAG: LPS assembly protein LptD [Rhodobacteraceae bacterium]|nr:LPS assembly protein LptD [Paracoccaceae bacterium]
MSPGLPWSVRVLARLGAALALGLALAFAVANAPAAAQGTADAATLVADRVILTGDRRITAEGNVEVFFRGAHLTATRIIYDEATDRLTVDGPIRLSDGKGTFILGSSADISRDLRDGIIAGARMVMQDRLQVAGTELTRRSGRYTELTHAVASSCQVCPSNPRPLWEIRAASVRHDDVTRKLTFTGAQLRLWGVPVAYLPRLTMPDPTVDRATGFLVPTLRSTSDLGTGIRLPYFIALGPSRDLTLTPYWSPGGTRTLGLRYRQAFAAGTVELNGALSRDVLLPGETRGYMFGTGRFDLPRDFRLDLSVQAVSDPAYILDYGLGDIDRLASGAVLSRMRPDRFIDARFFHYRSIREGEDNATLPTDVGDLTFVRRFSPDILGGAGGLSLALHGHRRTSTETGDLNGDGAADGRDIARASLSVDWRRNWILPQGILGAVMAEATADIYGISGDPAYPGTVLRFTPAIAAELRWPWVRATRGGAIDTIEPVAQIVLSPDSPTAVPNDDSLVVEFDEGNLFALNRFPGADAREGGLRANIGLGWTREDPRGWSLGLAAGRVLRAGDLGQFSAGSGLSGTASDWLVAASLRTQGGLTLTNRALFGPDLSFTRNELRFGWDGASLDLEGTYVWMLADPSESRPLDTSELTFDAGWQFGEGWRGLVSTRYDLAADRAARAGIGLQFRNECATVDLSLSRRFTSSTSVSPSTDFGLNIAFSGFGSRADGRPYRKTCGG